MKNEIHLRLPPEIKILLLGCDLLDEKQKKQAVKYLQKIIGMIEKGKITAKMKSFLIN